MAAPDGPRILLAIDYGTTFTGLAWVQQRDGSTTTWIHSNGDPSISTFTNWPGATEVNSTSQNRRDRPVATATEGKVPSQRSFQKTKNGNVQWGFSIDDDSEVLQWTKLELMPREPAKELATLKNLLKGIDTYGRPLLETAPRQLTFNAQDVIEDYLGKVVKEWVQAMNRRAARALENIDVDVVITYPASWGYDAINSTVRAVRRACHPGIIPKVRDFYLVPEPEACALFTVHEMLKNEHHTLYKGEVFLMVDAGGGTVDLASYRIDSVEPLHMTMIEGTKSAECGATFVNRAFLTKLEPMLAISRQVPGTLHRERMDVRLVTEDVRNGGHIVFSSLAKLLTSRFDRCKNNFDEEPDHGIVLPTRFRFPWYNPQSERFDDQEWDVDTLDTNMGEPFFQIYDQEISLNRHHMESFFHKSVRETIQLIDDRVQRIQNAQYEGVHLQISNIFLAGGFGRNPYLYRLVEGYARSENIGLQPGPPPEEPISLLAVAQGAILKVLGVGSQPAKKVHFCPRFYGVRLNQAYEEWKNHGMSTQQNRFTGRKMVNDQIVWLVQKDDVIQSGSSIKKTTEFQVPMETVQHRRGTNLRVSFVATAQLMAGNVVPSNMKELKQGKSPALTLRRNVLTMVIVPGESFDVLVDLSAIPRDELRKQKQAKGWGKYLIADFVAELEVNEREVSFIVKRWSSGRRDYVVEAKQNTTL